MSIMNECGSWFNDVSEGYNVTREQRQKSRGLGLHNAYDTSEVSEVFYEAPKGLGTHTGNFSQKNDYYLG